MEEGESAQVLEYTIPITTMGDRDPEEVYRLVKTIVENYEHYEDTTPDTPQFSLDAVLKEPLVVPFHAGTVRFFEERGVWTEELEEKNNALIERGERMREAWPNVVESSSEEELAGDWAAWKADDLGNERTGDES